MEIDLIKKCIEEFVEKQPPGKDFAINIGILFVNACKAAKIPEEQVDEQKVKDELKVLTEVALHAFDYLSYDRLHFPYFASHGPDHVLALAENFIKLAPNITASGTIQEWRSKEFMLLLFCAFILHDIGMGISDDHKDFFDLIIERRNRKKHDERSLGYIEKNMAHDYWEDPTPSSQGREKWQCMVEWRAYWNKKSGWPEPATRSSLVLLARICQAHGDPWKRFLMESELLKYEKRIERLDFFGEGESRKKRFNLKRMFQNTPEALEMLYAAASLLSLCDLCDIGQRRFSSPPSASRAALEPKTLHERRSLFFHWAANIISTVEYEKEMVVLNVQSYSQDEDDARILLGTNAGPGRDLLSWGNHGSLINMLNKKVKLPYKGAFAKQVEASLSTWLTIAKKTTEEEFVNLWPSTQLKSTSLQERFDAQIFFPIAPTLLCEQIADFDPIQSKEQQEICAVLHFMQNGWRLFDLFPTAADILEEINIIKCATFHAVNESSHPQEPIISFLYAFKLAVDRSLKLRSLQNPFRPPRIYLCIRPDDNFSRLSNGEIDFYENSTVIVITGGSLDKERCRDLILNHEKSALPDKPVIMFVGDTDVLCELEKKGVKPINALINNEISSQRVIESIYPIIKFTQFEKHQQIIDHIAKTLSQPLETLLGRLYRTEIGAHAGLLNWLLDSKSRANDEETKNGVLIVLALCELLLSSEDLLTDSELEIEYRAICSFLPNGFIRNDYQEVCQHLRDVDFPLYQNGGHPRSDPSLAAGTFLNILAREKYDHATWLECFTLAFIQLRNGIYNTGAHLFLNRLPAHPTDCLIDYILGSNGTPRSRLALGFGLVNSLLKAPGDHSIIAINYLSKIASRKNLSRNTFTCMLTFQIGFELADKLCEKHNMIEQILFATKGARTLRMGLLEALARRGFDSIGKTHGERLVSEFAKYARQHPFSSVSLMSFDVLWKYALEHHNLNIYLSEYDVIERPFWDQVCSYIHIGGSRPEDKNDRQTKIARKWGETRAAFNAVCNERPTEYDRRRKHILDEVVFRGEDLDDD